MMDSWPIHRGCSRAPVFFETLVATLALTALSTATTVRAAPDDDRATPQLAELGEFEQKSVRRVLDENGWRIDPQPAEKSVGRVHVVTLPVFSEHDPDPLQWLNNLHATTEPEVIRREVLLDPGDSWDREKIEETERNLRNPVFTSLAVVLPIESSEEGVVDLLVVVRDIWSLRTNSSFEYQNGVLSDLLVTASENNLLGRHKSVSATFDMDLGSFGMGPLYYDPNVFGTHAQFQTQADAVFSRSTGEFEGTRSSTTLSYPLWNLDRTWAGSLTVGHSDQLVRRFRGTDLLRYDNPDTATEEAVPHRYRFRTLSAEGRGTYAVGETVEHRFSLGYRYETQVSRFTGDHPADPSLRRAFRRDVMRPDERNSGPTLRYGAFIPEWITYRNISTYDLPEEEPIGPYLELETAPILEAFGSTRSFVEFSGTTGYVFDVARDGYVWFEGSATTRLRRRRWFDNHLYALFQFAAPEFGDLARVVARTRSDVLLNDTQNRLLFAGGIKGLRGYGIGAFAGTSRLLGSLELRSMPLEVAFTQLGGILFWDVGDAGEQLSELRMKNDIGAGLRILVPQVNTVPVRIDWAFPATRAGIVWPGRISIGFGQSDVLATDAELGN